VLDAKSLTLTKTIPLSGTYEGDGPLLAIDGSLLLVDFAGEFQNTVATGIATAMAVSPGGDTAYLLNPTGESTSMIQSVDISSAQITAANLPVARVFDGVVL
jgi:hypothetical protein